ncbi:MAG TPA: tetratricopeptide repeat protein, partial [Chitinophagaceae bacterium]|nr:tetratricopeptide repeat protein [Chitinophagaceae bacterium]
MKYLISFCLLFRVFISPAQENNPLLNSGEIIAKGVSLNDENKFKEAIELYKKVNRGDTNYFKALYEIAYSQYADSQFVACLQNCEKGLSEPNDHWPYLYSMYGNLLDDLGKPERALAIYDSAIALYPSFSELYLNKGTTLIRLKKFAEAEAVLKQNILINPYMSSAHFKLGLAALNQGKIVESFLCFVNYLLLAPQGRFQQNCISMLNAITNSTDEVREFQQKRSTEPIEDFALAERIVLSKIALDKNYKPLIKLDDPISRQIQVLFEKISYNENEPDFWMQCYVPHFKHFFSSGQFEAFTNRLFSGLNVEVVQDYVKKHKKELAAIVDEASAYYEKLRSTRELNFNAREKKSDWYHFDEGGLYGRGYFNSAGDVPVGDWEYYYTPGNIRTKGKFDEKGEKDGEWTYYHFNGLVRGKQRFNHGTQDGKEVFYFDNGLISSEGQFQNGLQTGQANVYFRTGQLNSTAHTIDGKLDGERVIYYNNGNKQALENYKADSLDGQSMNWYNTGPLQSKSLFSN